MNGITDAQIDGMLERILYTAGSSLRQYMPNSKSALRETMRNVVRDVIQHAVIDDANRVDAMIAVSKTGGSDA